VNDKQNCQAPAQRTAGGTARKKDKGEMTPDALFNDLPKQLASSNKCNDCKHIQKWACGGSFFFYCGVTKSNRTDNGLKKVKCKTPACVLFEGASP